MSLFGFRDSRGGGLEGIFYDYKMDQGYRPLPAFSNAVFGTMVRAMLPVNGAWHPEQPYPHFVSPAKLHARYFIYPGIQDKGAGAAFPIAAERTGPLAGGVSRRFFLTLEWIVPLCRFRR